MNFTLRESENSISFTYGRKAEQWKMFPRASFFG